MTLKEHTCFSVICDDCGIGYQGFEESFTVHFASPKAFAIEMKSYDEESAWRIEGDQHFCPSCACKRETDHALTEQIGDSRFCRCGSKFERSAA